MKESIIVAILSLAGTAIGSVTGIITANRMTVYRLEQLEKKVAAHNSLVERMYRVENKVEELCERRKEH